MNNLKPEYFDAAKAGSVNKRLKQCRDLLCTLQKRVASDKIGVILVDLDVLVKKVADLKISLLPKSP